MSSESAGGIIACLGGQSPAAYFAAYLLPIVVTIRAAHDTVRRMVSTGLVHSAHDVAEGGLAVALAECCLAGRLGARVWLPAEIEPFAEVPGRAFVVSGPEEDLVGPGVTIIGRVGGERLDIEDLLDLALSELHEARERGLLGFL